MRKFIPLLLLVKGFACTDFVLMDQNNHCVVGRSMEFGLDLKSEIISSPVGGKRESMINGKTGFTWTQNYAFIGLSALGRDNWIVDGMNEKGLSVGALWLLGSVYPEVSLNDLSRTIALQDVGAWLLGTCGTTEEAKLALGQVQIYTEKLAELGQIPPLHFALHDQTGNSAVVEFIDGEMKISNNPLGVLTNAPKFEWHMTNLSNYINLSPINDGPTNFGQIVIYPVGQGTGLLGLPGDWTPASRFVRIAVLKSTVYKAAANGANVNLAFHLLNTVDIPRGAIQEKSGKNADYTQWVCVKDLQDKTLYYRTYDNLIIKSINLNQSMKKSLLKFKM